MKTPITKMAGIRTRRILRGLGVDQAAEELGVTRQAWHAWEAGVSTPMSGWLPGMAEVLGCRIEDLYGEPDGLRGEEEELTDGAS